MKTQEELERQLQDAKKKREQTKKEKSVSYTQENKLVLQDNKFVPMRMTDVPVLTNRVFISGDGDKLFPFVFPDKDEHGDYILWRIIDRVLDRKWLGKGPDGKSVFQYPVKETHPEIFRMVQNNGNLQEGKFGPQGWYPKTMMLVNVINRMTAKMVKVNDNEEEETLEFGPRWCYDNNHTLLLCSAPSALGVTVMVHNMLLDTFIPNKGSIFSQDIAIQKTQKLPYYEIEAVQDFRGEEGYIKQVRDSEVKGPLSEADKKMEKYDLEALAAVTPATTIYARLKNKIGDIDKAMGTTFIRDLENLAEQELSSGKPPATPKSSEPATPPAAAPVSAPAPVAAPAATPEAPKTRARVASGPTVDSLAPFASKLTAEERAKYIKGIENGKIVFNTTDLAICPNDSCKCEQPVGLDKFCIYCEHMF